MTLAEFRKVFESALRRDENGLASPGAHSHAHPRSLPHALSTRGDHDLNPGMTVPENPRPASVLVPIVARPDGLTVLLTRRSDDLPVHPGQVSFPGGRVEEEDLDAIDTALRETEEEIGLTRDHIEVVGRLDIYKTRTDFEITPVVGIVTPPFTLTPDPVEVAEAFEVPLSFILDRSNHEKRSRVWRGQERFFYVLPHDTHYIWGATAGMLVNLADVLLDPVGAGE